MRSLLLVLLVSVASAGAKLAPVTPAERVPTRKAAARPCCLGRLFRRVLRRPQKLELKRRPATAAAAATAVTGVKHNIQWPIFACWSYFLSIALTAPAMPSLCNSLANADGSTKVTSAGVDLKGTFESTDQALTFLFDPLWGAVSDHIGRKPLQLLACSGATLGWGAFAFSRSVPLLLFSRAIDGVTSCMLPICQTSVQDITPPEKLVSNLGLLQGVAVGAAFIIGGMGGGILIKYRSPRDVFALASTIALCAGIVLAAFGPETLAKHRRAPSIEWSRANPLSAVGRLCGSRTSIGASAAFLLFWLGLNGLQVNLYNFASFKFGWEASTCVALQATSGLVLAFANVLGPRLLTPRIGSAGVIRLGMVGFALSLLGMGLSSSGRGFALAVVCGSVATTCLPGLTGLIAQQAAPGQTGAMLSALDSVSTLDRLLAYKLMSRLFAWGIGSGQPSIHFFVGSLAVLAGWLAFESTLPGVREAQAHSPPPRK